jgi:ClpP class serine protease
MANKGTTTGSIGVIMEFTNVEGLTHGKGEAPGARQLQGGHCPPR